MIGSIISAVVLLLVGELWGAGRLGAALTDRDGHLALQVVPSVGRDVRGRLVFGQVNLMAEVGSRRIATSKLHVRKKLEFCLRSSHQGHHSSNTTDIESKFTIQHCSC